MKENELRCFLEGRRLLLEELPFSSDVLTENE